MKKVVILLISLLIIIPAYSSDDMPEPYTKSAVEIEKVLLAGKDMKMLEGVVTRTLLIPSLNMGKNGIIFLKSGDTTNRLIIRDSTHLANLEGKAISFSDVKRGMRIKVFYKISPLFGEKVPLIVHQLQQFFKPDSVSILTFNGRVDKIFPIVYGREDTAAFMVLKNDKGDIKFAIGKNTRLFDSKWNPISPEDIKKGENVQLKYYNSDTQVKRAESLRKL